MTIKVRNRINIALFLISTVFLVCNICFLVFQILKNEFSIISLFSDIGSSKSILTEYNIIYPFISIIFLNIYVCTSSYSLYRSFEKTQASNIIYFNLFLTGCLANCFRIFIPSLISHGTFSNLIIILGNIIVYAKLIIPISILYTTIMEDSDKKHNTEQNIFIIILSAIFFAGIIPINSAKINPNLTIDHSLKSILNLYSIVTILLSLISLYLKNLKNQNSQKTTIGLIFISIGLIFIFDSINLLKLILGTLSLSFGTFYYIHELHKEYLWND